MQWREGISLSVISEQMQDNSLNVTTGNYFINLDIFRKYRRWDVFISMLSTSIKS
ncbi:hypothetical protein HMPREF3212_00678 [Citrobacter freundii]|nr:hypothetical protein HMPREF3212_00678 [Citrobacter freundii]